MKKLLIPVVAIVILAVLVIFVWPLVDAQLMQIPMSNGVAALSRGDTKALAESFTPDARILLSQGEVPVPVKEVIRISEPMLQRAKSEMPSMQFTGYNNLQRRGKQAQAGFTVAVQFHDKPVTYRGIVTLQRSGLFNWKIDEIGIYDLTPTQVFGE